MAKVLGAERQRSKANKRALREAKERAEQAEKDSEKRKNRAERMSKQRTKDEDKRRMGRGGGDALAGTSGEGGEFEVIQGRHYDRESGTYYGKDEDAGPYIQSEYPLDELFDNKFRRINGPTRLGRDQRRDKINSNVMDRPLAERIEDDMGLLDDEDFEDDTEEEDEDEEEEETSVKSKAKRRSTPPKADADEGDEANPITEGDEEEAEAVDRAARHRKTKRAKMRGKKK